MLRVLGGLWPLCSGTLRQPPPAAIAYVPQTPYFFLGTLRDQLLYPSSVAVEAGDLTKLDAVLCGLMTEVGLGAMVAREGGWDSVKQWGDIFSGGEKQRVAMARLLYNPPLFAVLDEATAAVSVDIESELLCACHRRRVTMISVSHRTHLRRFHRTVLSVLGDGDGGWTTTDIADQCLLPLFPGDSAAETGDALQQRELALAAYLAGLKQEEQEKRARLRLAAVAAVDSDPGRDADSDETDLGAASDGSGSVVLVDVPESPSRP